MENRLDEDPVAALNVPRWQKVEIMLAERVQLWFISFKNADSTTYYATKYRFECLSSRRKDQIKQDYSNLNRWS